MKKRILSAVAIAAVTVFTSCDRNLTNEIAGTSFENEAAMEEADVYASSSEYERNVVENPERNAEYGAYTKGVLEYSENNELIARFDFKSNELNKCNKTTKHGTKKKGLHKPKGKDFHFDKVVVEPVVKIDDCKFPVAGIVEYYKEGDLVATVDFGDGTCDNVATKTTEEGTVEFLLHPPKGKKGKKGCGMKKIVYEPMVKSDDCNCVVSGKVKYLKHGKTVALVDFGDGSCDNIATKTICFEGDCDNNPEVIEFTMDCDADFGNEAVTASEVNSIGLME